MAETYIQFLRSQGGDDFIRASREGRAFMLSFNTPARPFMIEYLLKQPRELLELLYYIEEKNKPLLDELNRKFPVLKDKLSQAKFEAKIQKGQDEIARYNRLISTFLHGSTTTQQRAQIINEQLGINDKNANDFLNHVIHILPDPLLIELLLEIYKQRGYDVCMQILDKITYYPRKQYIQGNFNKEKRVFDFFSQLSPSARNRHLRNWEVVRNEAMQSSMPIEELIVKGRNIRLQGPNKNSAMADTTSEFTEYLSGITTIHQLNVLLKEKVELYDFTIEDVRKLRILLKKRGISKHDKEQISKDIDDLFTNIYLLRRLFVLIRAKRQEIKEAHTPSTAAPSTAAPSTERRSMFSGFGRFLGFQPNPAGKALPTPAAAPSTVAPSTVAAPSTERPPIFPGLRRFFGIQPTPAGTGLPTPAAAAATAAAAAAAAAPSTVAPSTVAPILAAQTPANLTQKNNRGIRGLRNMAYTRRAGTAQAPVNTAAGSSSLSAAESPAGTGLAALRSLRSTATPASRAQAPVNTAAGSSTGTGLAVSTLSRATTPAAENGINLTPEREAQLQAELAQLDPVLAQQRAEIAKEQNGVNRLVAGVNKVSEAFKQFTLDSPEERAARKAEVNALMAKRPPNKGGRKSRKHKSRKHSLRKHR